MPMRALRIGFCALLCATLSAASAARAAECADQTQNGRDVCADAADKKADAALNAAYKEIIRRLKGDAAATKLLIAAQKAWIAYRDAECDFSSSAIAGGSIYPMVYSLCLEAATEERTKELGVFLKCGDGDTGCPVPAP
jgi:uncharacterized protein YecT (DUF1311 family)